MAGFITNPYGVQSPLAQALQNIAAAMFSKPPVNADLEDAKIANYRSEMGLRQAQMEKLQQDANNTKFLLDNADRNRQTGIADLIAGTTGLDSEKAGALALNQRLGGEIIPEFNDMNPQEMQLPLRAIKSAIGEAMFNDPTKLSGTGAKDSILKGYDSALNTLRNTDAINGTMPKDQLARMLVLDGKTMYNSFSNGVSADRTTGEFNQTGKDLGAATVGAEKALTSQRNSAAGLNSANTHVAKLKGDMLENTGGQDKVTVADDGSPTGFSYIKPDGGKVSGAPVPNSANLPAGSEGRGYKPVKSFVGYNPDGTARYELVSPKAGVTVTGAPTKTSIAASKANQQGIESSPQALAIRADYRAGKISKEQAKAKLKQLGISD